MSRKAELSHLSGEALLAKAVAQWDGIWARGARVHYPQQVLNDFFDSSIAYVLILTEYDAKGDLWTLDGPDVYRQYWGRGEYFQARAMEVAGYLSPARESVEHAFHIMNDDGEWDGPPTSGWPAWDNIGGNAGAVWDYYLYTRDKAWLAQAYPYLLRSSEWVRDASRGDDRRERGGYSDWSATHSTDADRVEVQAGAGAGVEAGREDLLVRAAAVVVRRLGAAGGAFVLA